jgi:Mg2+-importing ATPase
MTHLCTDKTGTLTEGVVQLKSATDIGGQPSDRTLRLAWLNTIHQAGYTNPIDAALRAAAPACPGPHEKLDEVPYDFHRRRISVLVACGNERWMITKGWVPGMLEICSHAEEPHGGLVDLAPVRSAIVGQFDQWSQQGYRTLGVGVRRLDGESVLTREHEAGMTFVGFLVFTDPLRPGVSNTLQELRDLGVRLKVITGDSHRVATHVSREAGLSHPRVITGAALRRLSEPALVRRVSDIDVFAEVEPDQKERIILALRKAGAVVGYLGDGINDIPAIHAADVGITVSSAVDAAREAADLVLLDRDLAVLKRGVVEGRATFANTLKYVFMATSANFGNMFSMAGASLFLPFLPLLPKQILLLNLLTDFPEMAIATDSVDPSWLARPRRWNLEFIRRFMVTFGLVSSLFDYLTFAVLLGLTGAGPEEFRSAWFVESAVSATLIVLVIRTREPLHRSLPSRPLLWATTAVVATGTILPFTPIAPALGFAPLRPITLVVIAGIVAAYVLTAEVVKRVFYRRVSL